MGKRSYAVRFLSALERKNKTYFTVNKLTIMDCVSITSTRPVTVHVTKPFLDPEISFEIETMFWKE